MEKKVYLRGPAHVDHQSSDADDLEQSRQMDIFDNLITGPS